MITTLIISQIPRPRMALIWCSEFYMKTEKGNECSHDKSTLWCPSDEIERVILILIR